MTIVDFGQVKQKKELMAAVLEAAARHGIAVGPQSQKALDSLIGNYIVESQAHYNEPGTRRDDAWAPRPIPSKQAYVFLPFGWATRAISRSYIGFRFAEGEFQSLVVDHLPLPDEMIKRSELKRLSRRQMNAEKPLDDTSIEQRLDALLNNSLWQGTSQMPVVSAARNKVSPQSDLSPLFNSDALERLGHLARTDIARAIARIAEDGLQVQDAFDRKQTGDRWQKLMGAARNPVAFERGIISRVISIDGEDGDEDKRAAFMQEVEVLLNQHELTQKQAVIKDFWERITTSDVKYDTAYHPRAVPFDPASGVIMAGMPPEYQTRQLYKFLTPLDNKRVKSGRPHEKSKKLAAFIDGAITEKRRAFVKEFPFMVLDLSQAETFYHHRKSIFDEDFDIEEVAQQFFAARQKFDVTHKSSATDVVDFLRGLTVIDMGRDIAVRFGPYTPYLQLLSPTQFPQTPLEWQYFKALVDTDKLFSVKAVKGHGDTFSELVGDDTVKSLYEVAYPLFPVEEHGRVYLQNVPLILEYINNYGSALFLPSMIAMIRDVYYAARQHDNGLHSEMKRTGFDFPDKIDTQCEVPFDTEAFLQAALLPLTKADKPNSYSFRLAQRMDRVLAELGGQGVPAYLAKDINIADIAAAARDFQANCLPYFEWREQQPRVKQFIAAPEKQQWLSLPTPSDAERRALDMPLSMRNISGLLSLKQAYNVLDVAYKDRDLVREVGGGTQYFMLTRPHDGDIVCVAKAEIKPIGSLNIFAWDDNKIILPETPLSGTNPDNTRPAIKDTLDGYGEWLAERHPTHTAERHIESRDALLSRPQQGTNRLSDIVGHDVFNLTENTQVTNFLKRYSAWPMRSDVFTGTAEIDGLRVVMAQIVGAMFNTEAAHILRLLDQQTGAQNGPPRHLRIV